MTRRGGGAGGTQPGVCRLQGRASRCYVDTGAQGGDTQPDPREGAPRLRQEHCRGQEVGPLCVSLGGWARSPLLASFLPAGTCLVPLLLSWGWGRTPRASADLSDTGGCPEHMSRGPRSAQARRPGGQFGARSPSLPWCRCLAPHRAGMMEQKPRCLPHSLGTLESGLIWPVVSEWFWPTGTQRLSTAGECHPPPAPSRWEPVGWTGWRPRLWLAAVTPHAPAAPPCHPFPKWASWRGSLVKQPGSQGAPLPARSRPPGLGRNSGNWPFLPRLARQQNRGQSGLPGRSPGASTHGEVQAVCVPHPRSVGRPGGAGLASRAGRGAALGPGK